MKKVYFATTNEGKIREAESILGIQVSSTPLDVDEIQSLDCIEVATKKARVYFNELKMPVFVEDNSLTFKALKKFPGPYINDFSKVLGNTGLIELLKGKKDRGAKAESVIVFIDAKGKDHLFYGSVQGFIARKPIGRKGFGWDPIFIPKGEKRTFAQMDAKDKNKYSMRAKALKKFKAWLDEGK